MIFKIFPEKDTWITNTVRNNLPQTGSNFGASEILELYKIAGTSGSIGYTASSSLARVILKFDVNTLSELTASGDAPTTGSAYFFKLFDAQHSTTLPSSFDVKITALSQSWDEGRGIDNDGFLDKGYANWDKSTSTSLWTTPGGDTITAMTASYHFDTGNEDISVDISKFVNAWLTGGLPNYGMMVKLTDSEETDSVDYYTKKFHGRGTRFLDKRPTIEMRFDDSVKDDRGVFIFDYNNTLYLYNKRRGQLTDIPGVASEMNVLDITISDVSGNVILNTSGSYSGYTGIYNTSVTLPSSSLYSGSRFSDAWSASGKSFMTGTFTPHNDGAVSVNDQHQYVVSMKGMKREYDQDEVVKFNLFVRTKNYNPPVVNTGSLAINNTVIEKGYYRVDNATTNTQVIPLGTGSMETTRLSYDNTGNHFKFHMRSLPKGEVYNLVFFFEIDGQLQKIEKNFKFRVV